MNASDAKRFGEVFGTLCEVFEKQTSPGVAKTYFSVLSDYSIDDVEVAAKLALQKCKFFPKPAELVEMIPGRMKPMTVKDKAAQQAAEVMRQIRQVGYYCQPKFDDQVTEWLLKTRWNWQSLCKMTESEHKWWQKEFQEAYQSASNDPSLQRRLSQPAIEGNGKSALDTLKLISGGIGKQMPPDAAPQGETKPRSRRVA